MKNTCKNPVLFIFFIALAIQARSQETATITIRDEANGQTIAGATLVADSRKLAESDKDGKLRINYKSLKGKKNIVIYKSNYKPDTLYSDSLPAVVYMKTLQGRLTDVVITGTPESWLNKPWNRYIIDYKFMGDHVLVATHAGRNKTRLYVVDKIGDVVVKNEIPLPVDKLFRSCNDYYYAVTYKGLYPIHVSEEGLTTGAPMSLDKYRMLEQCVLQTDEAFYYKISYMQLFMVQFAMTEKDKVAPKIIDEFFSAESLYRSIDDIPWIMAAEDPATRRHRLMLVQMWNAAARKKIDARLFLKNDSLLIFNFEKNMIHCYETDGEPIQKKEMLFEAKPLKRPEIIQDVATGAIYALYRQNKNNELVPVNPATGDSGNPVKLAEQYVTQPQIRNNVVYYLSKADAGVPVQLFKEHYAAK